MRFQIAFIAGGPVPTTKAGKSIQEYVYDVDSDRLG